MIEEHIKENNEEFNNKDFEDTIELEKPVEEHLEENEAKITSRKRVEKNVLEDFDDLFLDE